MGKQSEVNVPGDLSSAIAAARRAADERKHILASKHPDLFDSVDNIAQKPLQPKKMVLEQNILEKPFTVYNNRQSKERSQILIESETDVTTITAVPDDNGILHGLPIPFDRRCLFAVMINSESLKDSNQIRMSKADLCRHMGINRSGRSYHSIEETQHRLFNTIIAMTGGWFDPTQKKRVPTKFRILSRIASPGNNEFVWWFDDVIVNSFRENYVKTLDFNRFLNLKSPLAQFAYGFLSKRVGTKTEWRCNLSSFVISVGYGHYLTLDKYRRIERIKANIFEPLNELRPDFRYSLDGSNIVFHR